MNSFNKSSFLQNNLTPITRQRTADFAGALQRLLACLQRHIEEVKPPFIRDIQREDPELFQLVEVRRRTVIQRHLGKVLARGRREGFVRKDISLRLIMEILLAAMQAIVNPSKLLELGLTPKRGAIAIISLVFDGVLTRGGRLKR